MFKNTFSATILSLALLSSNGLLAEGSESSNRPESGSGWSFSVGASANFDSEVAAQEGVEDSAVFLSGAWEKQNENLVFSAGLNIYFLSDEDSFNVLVEDNDGDISLASSDALGFGGFGEIGYSFELSSDSSRFDLLGGLEIISAERSIANCTNCPSESISIDGGLYVKPRFRYFTESNFVFSVELKQYLSGDVENSLGLNFAWLY